MSERSKLILKLAKNSRVINGSEWVFIPLNSSENDQGFLENFMNMDGPRVSDSSLNSDFQLNNIETASVSQIEPSQNEPICISIESEITRDQETSKNTSTINNCPIDDITACVPKELPVPNQPFFVLGTQITEKEGTEISNEASTMDCSAASPFNNTEIACTAESSPILKECVLNSVESQLSAENDESDEEPFSSDDSVRDLNFVPEFSSSSDDENLPDGPAVPDEQKKVRKRKANPESWKKNIAKRQRNSGQSYISCSKTKKTFKKREIGKPCKETCWLKCSSYIPDETRLKIFSDYWKLADLQSQRCFLSAHIEKLGVKYRYTREGSSRKPNNAFYFMIDGRRHRVCKTFFKSTLAISDRPIRTIIEKKTLCAGGMISSEMRGKHGKHHRVEDTIKNGIRRHIESIPKIESHYRRSDSKRDYIEGGRSLAEIHRDYVNTCKEKNEPFGNYLMFSRIFNSEFNISFYSPKKDQCEDCVAYFNASDEEKDSLKQNYDSHLIEKDLSRQEKAHDKENSPDTTIVAVYDLQAVLQCPRGDVSCFYYTSKLNVFNLTVYEIKTNTAKCFVWDESQANRGVCEIGTCLLKYVQSLETYADQNENKVIDIIFFSDNCCGQQKNRFMLATYFYIVQNYAYVNSITHKFLIKGHTQNEGDSVHSVIERQITRSLKSGPIYVPDQYVTLIRTAKKTGQPYAVEELNHESFFDLKDLAKLGFNNLKTSTNVPLKIGDLRIVKFVKNQNKLFFKNSFEEKEFQTAEIKTPRSNRSDQLVLHQLYATKPSLNDKKKESILGLFKKNVVPKYYFNFFNSL
ncbi:uncharacterized protein LOC115886868 [Sitophilus oryzae]|uniref:Uncharacterized protein LOC115886868 n=1 Tax=Sitophilus oryzae TaxID=7048 RepID=A0A6J2YF51_SITOR|nr:uncharacterized protein LOC115886868 [Sitophilus oryzae]